MSKILFPEKVKMIILDPKLIYHQANQNLQSTDSVSEIPHFHYL